MVETATSPFQYALSTKAETECIAHALQALTELHPEATTDGISACDLTSQGSHVAWFGQRGRREFSVAVCADVHRVPSEYLWEQGDATMPLLFCLGQHQALQAIQLRGGEYLMAFLDGLNILTLPDSGARVRDCSRRTPSPCLHTHPGRRRFGTGEERIQQHVMSLRRGWPDSSTRPQCGRGQVCQSMSKASKSLGPGWATRILLPPMWSEFWQNTRLSSIASLH